MKIVLTPSTRRTKKWTVRIDDRTVHFGARGSSDYTINKDPKRRAAYIARHRKREDWNDPYGRILVKVAVVGEGVNEIRDQKHRTKISYRHCENVNSFFFIFFYFG